MAYAILSLVAKELAPTRDEATKRFQIDRAVLSKIGELTAENRGDSTTARKFEGKPLRDLSGAEKYWLEEAIRRVILRLGEHVSAAGSVTRLELRDLPPL
jgi:hypothetical protein